MPAAREIAARESRTPALSRPGADQRDFEGPFGERLRAGAHSQASVTLRAPAAGPPPAGGDERGARKRKAPASLSLRRAFQRRPGWESLRPGRSVPTREAAPTQGRLRGEQRLEKRQLAEQCEHAGAD